MGYRVYAGTITKPDGVTDGFQWAEKNCIFDSAGDSIEGHEYAAFLEDPVWTQEKNQFGSFECTIPYQVMTPFSTFTNPIYGTIAISQTWIEVDEDGTPAWLGYVTELELQFDKSYRLYAEGVLGKLQSYSHYIYAGYHVLTDPGSSRGDSIFGLCTYEENMPCGTFTVGEVTVQRGKGVDTTDKGAILDTDWNILNSLLLDEYDGYLRARIVVEGSTYHVYVDYLADIEETTDQTIEYGVNLLDFTYSLKMTSDFVTRIIAYGTNTTTEGWWIFKKTSITAINASYIDEEAEAKYGRVEKMIAVDGNSTYESLEQAAKEELATYSQTLEPTMSLRAFDRKDAGENVQRLGYLKRTHIISEPHGIDNWLVCTKASITLAEPDNKRYEFGLPPEKLTRQQNTNSVRQQSISLNMRGVLSSNNG